MIADRGISAARSLAYLAAAWGTIAAAFAAVALWPAWWTVAIAFVVVSSRQSALLIVEHECWHYNMFRRRRTNDLVGSVLSGWAVGSPYLAGRTRHLAHHRHLGSHDDPDFNYHSSAGKESAGRTLRYFLGLLLGRQLAYVLFLGRPGATEPGHPPATPRRRADLAGITLTQALIFAALAILAQWWMYPLLWILPLVTLTTFANGVRAFVEHYSFEGDAVSDDDRLFTIEASWWERAFFSPMNFNFHAEHHLRPATSAFRLPDLRRPLVEEGRIMVRRGYLATMARVLRTRNEAAPRSVAAIQTDFK